MLNQIVVAIREQVATLKQTRALAPASIAPANFALSRAMQIADWTLIAEVCNNPRMHIPIIGNGDIDSGEICLHRFNESGVAAVMIGRACIGRPWIFKEIKHYLATGTELELDNRWKMEVLKQQILNSIDRLDERRGILHIRRHLAATPLFKGRPNFRETRIAMLRAEHLDELFRILDGIEL